MWIKANSVWEIGQASADSGKALEDPGTCMSEDGASCTCGKTVAKSDYEACETEAKCNAAKLTGTGDSGNKATCKWTSLKKEAKKTEGTQSKYPNDTGGAVSEAQQAAETAAAVIQAVGTCLSIGSLIGGMCAIFNGLANGIVLPVIAKDMAILQCIGVFVQILQMLCNIAGGLTSMIFIFATLATTAMTNASTKVAAGEQSATDINVEAEIKSAIEGSLAPGLVLTFLANFMCLFWSCYCCSLKNANEISKKREEAAKPQQGNQLQVTGPSGV